MLNKHMKIINTERQIRENQNRKKLKILSFTFKRL